MLILSNALHQWKLINNFNGMICIIKTEKASHLSSFEFKSEILFNDGEYGKTHSNENVKQTERKVVR